MKGGFSANGSQRLNNNIDRDIADSMLSLYNKIPEANQASSELS